MTLDNVVRALATGYKIKRKCWEYQEIELFEDTIYSNNSFLKTCREWVPTIWDLLAQDWEVVE